MRQNATSRHGRRVFLRGVGTVMALPWLESVGRAKDAVSLDSPPLRSAFLFFPNGVVPDCWHADDANDFTNSPILRPLTRHRQDIVVLRNLWHEKTFGRDGHWSKDPVWLSGGYVQRGDRLDVGCASIDQLMADIVGQNSILRSIQLGTEPPRAGVDLAGGGFARLVGSSISWRDMNTPVAKEIDPRAAFNRLFHINDKLPPGIPPGSDRAKAAIQYDDRSILDAVLEEAHYMRRKVSQYDQAKLDEYLQSVRDIERRIEAFVKPPTRWVNKQDLDIEFPKVIDHQAHVRLMLDIVVLAFWTDTTRISTFMFADAQSQREFDFLPDIRKKGWHSISHHSDDPLPKREHQAICTWHVQQLAYLIERMKSLKEMGKPLLDNCQVLFGTSISDGNLHEIHDLPLILAGKAGGAVRTGRVLDPMKDTPMCNLLLQLGINMGVQLDQFGDSSSPLDLT